MQVRLTAIGILAFLSACAHKAPQDPQFVTAHKIAVHYGKGFRGKIYREDIEKWTRETIVIWRALMPDWGECLNYLEREGFDNSVTFESTCPIKCKCGPKREEKYVYGYTYQYSRAMFIANCNADRYTFIHELSHVIWQDCGGIFHSSHYLWKATGFPY